MDRTDTPAKVASNAQLGLAPERDQAGPRGTYGCACVSRDAAECHRRRYGIVAGDVSHGAEECYCLCHQWSDDDDA